MTRRRGTTSVSFTTTRSDHSISSRSICQRSSFNRVDFEIISTHDNPPFSELKPFDPGTLCH